MPMPSGVCTPGYASIVTTPRVLETLTMPELSSGSAGVAGPGAPLNWERDSHALRGSSTKGSTTPLVSASVRLMPIFRAPKPSGPSTGAASGAGVIAAAPAVVGGVEVSDEVVVEG